MNLKKSEKGFTLVEIMISLGLLGVLLLGVLQLNSMMTQSKVQYDAGSETALITNEIVATLSNPSDCLATLGGRTASSTAPGNINSISRSGSSRYAINGAYGDARIVINSYALSASDKDVSIASHTTKLLISFKRKKMQSGGGGDIVKKIRLYVDTDATGKITFCRSLSSSSTDVWTRGTGADIFYAGGNVGIGKTNPDVSLDVAGGIKLGDQNEVTLCDSDTEGTIRYNKLSHLVEYCAFQSSTSSYEWSKFNSVASSMKFYWLDIPRKSHRSLQTPKGLHQFCALSRVSSGGNEGGGGDYCFVKYLPSPDYWVLEGNRGDDPAISCQMICF